MFTDTTDFLKLLSKHLVKISIAGLFIGLFYRYDALVALILLLKLARKIYNYGYLQQNYLVLIGMLLTGVVGISAEHWGVSNGYWQYHGIEQTLPYWLPFAWMLAFCFLYQVEKEAFALLTNNSFKQKLSLTIFIVSFFPVLGEIITIALGVWTYYWPYKIFGVPLLAILCLTVLHLSINLLLTWINIKFKLKDNVLIL